MTIRLAGLIDLKPVGILTSRVAKECINSEIEDALEKSNNLEQTVDNTGKFDKKKGDATEDVVFDEKDEEADIKPSKFPSFKEMNEDTDHGDDRDMKKSPGRVWHTDTHVGAKDKKGITRYFDKKKPDAVKKASAHAAGVSEEIDPSTAKLDSANESGEEAGASDDGTPSTFAGMGLTEENTNRGTDMPMFREMIRNTERALKLTESPKSLTKNELRNIVKEEYNAIIKEQQKNAVKIDKKLHELRERLIKELLKAPREISESGRPVLVKTLQISTVCELIGVPINELVMFFLNNVKASQHRHLVEYHLGCVYFFGN